MISITGDLWYCPFCGHFKGECFSIRIVKKIGFIINAGYAPFLMYRGFILMLVVVQGIQRTQLVPILFKRVTVVHEEILWEMGLVTLVDLQYRADHPALLGGGVVPLEWRTSVRWAEVGEKETFACDPRNGYLAVSFYFIIVER